MQSIHNKLEKVRKPRVHIKYEVETEDGTVEKELPFVVGVMGNYAGDSELSNVKSLRQRNFINIDQDNFDEVMQRISPELHMRVVNKLTNEENEIAINLNFKSIRDFEPVNIVKQVPALQKLKETRDKLRDLLTKIDRSDELEKILETILQNSEHMQTISKELGLLENKGA